ncbi:MAG TPA: tetratricopeptide repeat protein, partial [Acidobacteriaceae bacterium]|nr:tetratricopeptide repeat protein [Acidobacteriaceae bacterium]
MSAAHLSLDQTAPKPQSRREPSSQQLRALLHEQLVAARAAHGRGDLREAAEQYRRVLFVSPAHAAALLGLSLIARQSSQFEPALHMAQAAVAASPLSALAWSNLGDILLAGLLSLPGKQDEKSEEAPGKQANAAALLKSAERAFERALTLDAQLHAAHLGLGNAVAQREDYAAALQHFSHAAELAPDRAEIQFALAFAHGKLGQHGAAVDHYRRALLVNPAFASAWLNLGVELVADGRDQLAPACYAQAIQAVRKAASDPLATELSAHLNLGHLARSRQR